MSGMSAWQKKIELDISTAQKQLNALEKEVNNKQYTIDIGVNKEQLESVITNLDKMLKSLGKGTGDFKQFENLAKELTAVTSEVKDLSNAFGKIDGDSGAKNLLTCIQSIDSSLTTLTKHITEVNVDFGNIGKNANTNVGQIQNAQKATESLASATKDLADAQGKVSGNKTNLSSENTSGVNATAEAMGNLAEQTKNVSSAKEQFVSTNNNVSSSVTSTSNSVSKEAQAIEEASSSLKKFQNAYNTYSAKPKAENQNSNYQASLNELEQINKTIKDITSKPIDLITDTELNQLEKAQTRGNELLQTFKSMTVGDKGSTLEGRLKFINKMQDTLSKNTNFSKEAQQQIETYISMLKTMGSDAPFEEIRSGFYGIVSAEKAAGREGKSFFDVLKEKTWYSNISSLATTFFSWYQIFNVFKEASNTVIELNTNITELAKVSEKTSSQIYDDFNSYAEIAKEVGGTISDTISATADWSRNGYDIEASKELSKAALIYKNVGDGIDIDEANEYLISTLRGFNLEAEQAMDIIDSINNVANNEPIDTAGIGEALQRSAAAFNAANTDLQESIALVTSTNSVLQSPDKVGSMWTTVSARIRGATTELEEAGEDTDGMVESTSKLQALIKGMTGFDILEEDGKTFKSIYDIIIGIGEEFQNLDDIDQASLLEALAGETLNCLKIWKHILKNIFNCKENLKLYATI